MRLRLTRIGNDKTVVYAMEEVSKYLRMINPNLFIDEFVCNTYEEYAEEPADSVLFGIGIGVEEGFDDCISIDIKKGIGVITGPNARSVLFSAYRFLYELGCRFPTPEEDSDVIPQYDLKIENINIKVDEKPSYRHRGIGDLLLHDALERAAALHCRILKLSIIEENTLLRKWYEAHGFVHTGTQKFDFFPFTCGYMEIEIGA